MMSAARTNEMLRAQSSVAQKVYAVVPISETWSVNEIIAELGRCHQITEHSVVGGCLGTLVNTGLITGNHSQGYRRVPVKEKREKEMVATLTVAPAVPPPPVDPLEMLSELVTRINQLSHDLQEVALALTAKLETQNEDARKLEQLRSLLKG